MGPDAFVGIAGAVAGFRLPFEGGRLLIRERRLWLFALVPVLLSLLAFGVAVALLVTWSGPIHDFATSWIPVLAVDAWWQWIWMGPARAILFVLGTLIFALVCAAGLVVAFLIASVLAAPFHDLLSRRVEEVLTGNVVDDAPPGIGGAVVDGLRALREELRRLVFFFGMVIPIAALGFVIPPAQVVTGPTVMALTIFFLPLDYASYALDRRRYSFRQKREWLLSRTQFMAGFGGAAFVLCVVPGVNFVATPVLVIAGTILVLRDQEGAGSSR